MSLRIFKDTKVPQYIAGKWIWDEQSQSIKYIARETNSSDSQCVIPTPIQRKPYIFQFYLDQVEEIIFRERFNRPKNSHDSDVITIQDIKNFTLFMAPSNLLTPKLIEFLHTRTVDKFLNALIIYFEYFLKVYEFILIRRDEITEKYAKIQTIDSVKLKIMLADYLSQYRLLLAREYTKIILGTNDVAIFHHIDSKVKVSRTIKDKTFHRTFIAFIIHFTWITMHRKAYKVIDHEINRLLRSTHFNPAQKPFEFTPVEEQVLYGRHNKIENYRAQKSPLIQEIIEIEPKNLPILWIGEKKYRGTDPRIYQLELEYVVPGSQLCFIDISHGILGHSKNLYNTMLVLNWHSVRKLKFDEKNDPFRLIRQPCLHLPNWDSYKKEYKTFESYFYLQDISYEEDVVNQLKKIWKRKDEIIKEMKSTGIVNNIIVRCINEIKNMDESVVINTEKIISDFLKEKSKLRKQKDKL